jgi:two-component system phosphate regulon sensor histidine kinase PhoR
MGDGGAIKDNDKYSELFLRITRTSGILVPFVAASYGIAAAYKVVGRSPAYSGPGLFIMASLFVLLGIVQDIHKPNKPVSLGVYIGLYHVIGLLYLYVGPGFISPIAFCWIVLAFITEIFYGGKAVIITFGVITLSAVVTFLAEPNKRFHAFNYAVYLLIILVSCAILILLRRVQLVEHEDLKRTQVQEQFQREQLRALINNVGMAIASTTYTGRIQSYNAAMLELLDTHESLNGKQLDEVFHFVNSSGKPVLLKSILSTTHRVTEREDLRHKFASGEMMNVSISCAPISSNATINDQDSGGYIFIIRDITKAKSLEEEREEFISVVSHELRTPVATVEATISLMLYQMEHNKDPAYLEPAFQTAHKQILYLASMIKDLTTLSRAERGVADMPETVNVNEVMTELHRNYLERARNKGLELQLELLPDGTTVPTSKLYLEEILQNFMTNAIKYTEKGRVTIGAKNLANEVEFIVKDTGIGISKSDQKRIFDKFYRSEDYLTRKHSGTGLGLYVVHKLAQKVHGKIRVDSTLNEGSTFTLVLQKSPAKPAPTLSAAGPAAEADT